VAKEIDLASRFDAIICDRAVLDNYAYMVHATGERPELEAFIAHWMKTYTLLVKVPIVEPPPFDGTRDTSVEFQRDIDRLIDKLLDRFQLLRLALPAASRGEWIGRVLRQLSLPRRPPQLDLFTPRH
jgi:hypothetical protein